MKKYFKYIICFLIFILGLLSMYLIIYFYPSLFTKEVTKVEKDVTITENGISEAVSKVYDSVVIVLNYQKDSLYATGSGFVYKIDGNDTYIVTNEHVIEDGTSFKITISDDETLDATLVGYNDYFDVAVLKVETNEHLPLAEIGSSENLNVGDTVFAIGAPVSSSTYAWTVTRGIISGKNRVFEFSDGTVMSLLQTDTAVNSGNSGGPLCNSNGQVIGIVNAKITLTNVDGIGFAIPIERVSSVANKILNNEEIVFPYLGVSTLDVYIAKNYSKYNSYLNDTSLDYGAIILEVEDKSSADKAGLKSGDVILSINDVKIKNTAAFKNELFNYEPGDTIKITYNRDGKEYTTNATLSKKN